MKILIASVVLGFIALSFFDDGVDEQRGCVASAYQAEARGIGDLETNLTECERL